MGQPPAGGKMRCYQSLDERPAHSVHCPSAAATITMTAQPCSGALRGEPCGRAALGAQRHQRAQHRPRAVPVPFGQSPPPSLPRPAMEAVQQQARSLQLQLPSLEAPSLTGDLLSLSKGARAARLAHLAGPLLPPNRRQRRRRSGHLLTIRTDPVHTPPPHTLCRADQRARHGGALGQQSHPGVAGRGAAPAGGAAAAGAGRRRSH